VPANYVCIKQIKFNIKSKHWYHFLLDKSYRKQGGSDKKAPHAPIPLCMVNGYRKKLKFKKEKYNYKYPLKQMPGRFLLGLLI
jgi:hypothetical protein